MPDPESTELPRDEVGESLFPGRDAPTITTSAEEARGPYMTRGFLAALIGAIVLGWIPLLGAIIAGSAGGYEARSRYRALYACLLPAAITGGWGFFFVWFLPGWAQGTSAAPWVQQLNQTVTGGNVIVFTALVGANFILCILSGWFTGAIRERRGDATERHWPRPV
ncbi:MAG: hypothetical protein ACYDDF_15380 [Thermoplasmatota archaeon]